MAVVRATLCSERQQKKKLQRAWIKASTGAGKSFNGGVEKSFNEHEKKLQTEVRAETLRAAACGTVVLRWTCYEGDGLHDLIFYFVSKITRFFIL